LDGADSTLTFAFCDQTPRPAALSQVSEADSVLDQQGALAMPRGPAAADDSSIRRLLIAHFDFIWRSLRRLGVPEHSVDDAAQEVFVIANRKLEGGPPRAPKAFLFAIALRVAAADRRHRSRRSEVGTPDGWAEIGDSAPGPDELLDRQRARRVLDDILRWLPIHIRVVFMLFEMEEMTTKEIAEFLSLPLGTVASRLRRGRELFQQEVERLRVRRERGNVR
jgi:RNA polymerase sigma-70 factor, ECF subfamily